MSNPLDDFAAAQQPPTPDAAPTSEGLQAQILAATKKGVPVGLLDLARQTNATISALEEAIAKLREAGQTIEITEAGRVERYLTPPRGELTSHYSRLTEGGWIRFGLLGDNQMGSRKSRLDVAQTAYEHYKAEGIDTVYHTGNLIDGFSPRINLGELHEDAGVTLESQSAYARRYYPKVDGITTYFITGECHEGWWAKQTGINVGRIMEDRFRLPLECSDPLPDGSRACEATIVDGACTVHGRTDLVHLGFEEADIELRSEKLRDGQRGPIMRLTHPGGGSSYAMSYKTQKMSESFQGGEKPQILAVGHFHKFDWNYHREVHNVQTGCLCDQTLFMRKHQLQAHVGYLICDAYVAPDGVLERFRVEFKPFYDQGFYKTYTKW